MNVSEIKFESFETVLDGILAQPDKELTDSASLKSQMENLKLELRNYVNSGDAEGVIKTQGLLMNLPLRIRAAEIAEIKSELDTLPGRLEQLKSNEAEIIQLRAEPAKELGEMLERMDVLNNEVARYEFALGVADSERKGLEVYRRELRARLSNLTKQIEEEMNYEFDQF